MLFNSIEFVIFLPLVLVLYWRFFNKNIKARNAFLLIVSYCFYSFWDVRFLGLIFLSSAVDFFCGIQIGKVQSKREKKFFLVLSLSIGLGILGFFKYYDFFVQELVQLVALFGYKLPVRTLHIILPVGISFYTFQTLSYTLDVYYGRIKPTRDGLAFFAFVSFFPQLVAGPIERASRLLPQFGNLKSFQYDAASAGFRRVLWGLFAKVVVADTIAVMVDQIFANHAQLTAPVLILGSVLFTLQIYADFSGYSNIAIGTAQLMGFQLMENFRYPLFSVSIREFWSRWHISLSTWFRDYVYIPLGGNRKGNLRTVLNIMVVFVLSGLWHGANSTFLIWGVLHGLFYLAFKPFESQLQSAKTGWRFVSGLFTFGIVCFAFIFFRSDSLSTAIDIIQGVIINQPSQILLTDLVSRKMIILPIFFSMCFIGIEWMMNKKENPFSFKNIPVFYRYMIYWGIIFSLLYTFQGQHSFIYFQF